MFKQLVIKILFTVILAFIGIFFFIFFKKIFVDSSSAFLENSLSAFLGAFFAFLFIRIGDGLNKIYERHIKHYNALVKLELILNKYFITIDLNIMALDYYKINLKETTNTTKISLNPHTLTIFLIHDDILLELLGQYIINKVLLYNTDLYKLNNDMETTNKFYEEIKIICLEKNDVNTYIYNLKNIADRSETLKKFINKLREDTINLLSEIRVLSEEKPIFTKIMFKFLLRKQPKKYKQQVEKEKEKLQEEIKHIMEDSQKEIDKLKSQ